MVNEFICVGNLVKDPTTKTVKEDTTITNFVVAVNGYKKEDVSYFSCISFGKTGEAISKYCKKGSEVLVKGSMHTRTYEDKKKVKHFVTEVIVEKCEFLRTPSTTKKETEEAEESDMFPFEL